MIENEYTLGILLDLEESIEFFMLSRKPEFQSETIETMGFTDSSVVPLPWTPDITHFLPYAEIVCLINFIQRRQ